ncbi:MAG: ABC transporter ATP-binding protein [Bradymonadaceae bacterium]|nr:ABC transporter ATP-binding protein [Lujinxingiaceae bacterium]
MSEQSPKKKAKRPDGSAIGSGFAEQKLGTYSDGAILWRLWGYMRPYRLVFLVCLLLLPILSGVSLMQPWLLQIAIDDYLIPAKMEGIELVALAFGATILGRAILEFTQFYLMQFAGQRALRDLRNQVFGHVQGLSASFFKKNPIGRLMARMTTDVESLQEALSSGMITMVGDVITLAAIVVILLLKNWKLALVCFTVVPILLIFTSIFRYLLRTAFREVRIKIARLYAHLQESITGMSVIQLFVRERVSAAEYRDINEDYRDANIRSIRYDAMLYSLVETIGSVTIGAIIWYGSGQALDGLVTLGVLVAFIEYMQKFFVPIRDLAQKYNLLQSAMASSERIFQLLDTDERIARAARPTALPAEAFEIEFRDVWFAYNDEDWILRGISFVVTPGDKVALVGHTGAGKTTIIALLTRLYDVTRGQILINGIDIREFDLHEYRRRFAVVLQDVFLFQGTIFENLSLGVEGLDEAEVIAAAQAVHAHPMILRQGDGYAHQVAERGSNLSSGEKQLLAFARALVRKPDVLILDEATANVDTDTEALIQDAVEVLMARQTSLVIAHRLSTIQKADRIIVLHKGELIETGTHDELVVQDGHYGTLYRLQYATEREDASPTVPA